jgi:hypothetical protein
LSRKFLTPIALPHGNTNPAVGTIGALFYRSDLNLLHIYTGSGWVPVGGGSDLTNIDGGVIGEGLFLIGGQPSTTSFSATVDGGSASTTSFESTYSGGTI